MSEEPMRARPLLVPKRPGARPRTRTLPKTPLALAVLNLLHERSMHPYEMRSMMLERGHDRAVRLKEASLYDTVARLAKLGFIEELAVSREGRRPERTVYAITPSGRDELLIWLRELVSVPAPEYPNFAAALMFVYALGKDGTILALMTRSALLEAEISRIDTYQQARFADIPEIYLETLPAGETEFPRLFLIEEEYAQAMRRAELSWVRQVASDLRDGTLPWPDFGEPEDVSLTLHPGLHWLRGTR